MTVCHVVTAQALYCYTSRCIIAEGTAARRYLTGPYFRCTLDASCVCVSFDTRALADALGRPRARRSKDCPPTSRRAGMVASEHIRRAADPI